LSQLAGFEKAQVNEKRTTAKLGTGRFSAALLVKKTNKTVRLDEGGVRLTGHGQ